MSTVAITQSSSACNAIGYVHFTDDVKLSIMGPVLQKMHVRCKLSYTPQSRMDYDSAFKVIQQRAAPNVQAQNLIL